MKTRTFLRNKAVGIVICFALLASSCSKDGIQQPLSDVITATGDSASILSSLNAFRSLLSDSLNTVPGKTGGRREINWDAVPVNLQDNNNFPSDFFAQTDPTAPNGRKRGAIFTTALTSDLRISSKGFEDVYAGLSTQIKAFSPKLILGTANGHVIDVTFKVPGQSTDATVKGFGVIFLDVDKDNTTSLEFFDETGASLGKFFAKKSDAKFSLLGVKFKDEHKVTRVRITAGEAGIAATPGYEDKVGMDDFLYDEPVAK